MTPALFAWVGLFAYVVAYDTWALATGRQTLSSGFWSVKGNRWGRYVVVPLWLLLSTHLLLGWPNF